MPKERLNRPILLIKTKEIEGFLKKKSPHLVQGWQSRFCRVIDKKFIYYEKKNDEHPMGILDFELMAFSIVEIKENNCVIGFKYEKK